MQLVQSSQFKNALGDGGLAPSQRHSVLPASLAGAPQRNPFRRRPTRLQRATKADFQRIIAIRQHVLAGESTAAGIGTGTGGALYQALEEASRRIALRLHDESAQMLATVYLELAVIARGCPDSTVQKINGVVKQLDGVREQLRGLSHELSPPVLDQFGLMPALQSLANGVRNRSGLKTVVSGNITSVSRLVGTVLYRVVQEALSNVVRHAKATEAVVRLSIENNRIYCTVSDDGIGFTAPGQHQPAPPGVVNDPVYSLVPGPGHGPVYGLGLAGIHERVTSLKGRCRIGSCRNGGMELMVEIPL
jgi:two-component system sensor histidine kinase UhpB